MDHITRLTRRLTRPAQATNASGSTVVGRYVRSLVQNDVQQRGVDFQMAVVINEGNCPGWATAGFGEKILSTEETGSDSSIG